MARAAAGVLSSEHSPCGPVTWAPAFAGVTLVGGVRERLDIAVKSKPIVQHGRHARGGGNPDHVSTQVCVSLKYRAQPRG